MLALARRHPLTAFFALAYALSWWPRLWLELAPATAPGAILPPGPLLAALIMSAVQGRLAGVGAFLRKILLWRVALRWYALVLGLPPLLTLAAVALNLLIGATRSAQFEAPSWPDLAGRFVFIFVLIGLGEEPAWRGYALPRLLAVRSALMASLVLGALHVVWHLPLLGIEYGPENGAPWVLSVLAYSVVVTWVYLHTGGSLLLPALFHTSVNTAAVLFGMFTGDGLLSLWWLFAGLWCAVALGVVLAAGTELRGRHPFTAGPPPLPSASKARVR